MERGGRGFVHKGRHPNCIIFGKKFCILKPPFVKFPKLQISFVVIPFAM